MQRNLFLKKLKNVTDPEKKRKIIGNLFIKDFEKYAKKIKNLKFLAQGTLYPDLLKVDLQQEAKHQKSNHIIMSAVFQKK